MVRKGTKPILSRNSAVPAKVWGVSCLDQRFFRVVTQLFKDRTREEMGSLDIPVRASAGTEEFTFLGNLRKV